MVRIRVRVNGLDLRKGGEKGGREGGTGRRWKVGTYVAPQAPRVFTQTHIYLYIYMCVYVYIYIYIHIYIYIRK